MFNSKRVFFPKGKQRKFINRIIAKFSIREIAKTCEISERTIRDWRREKFSINYGVLKKMCKKTKIVFPSNVHLKNRYWYVSNGSSAGGKAVFKKYGRIGGNQEYRKKKWYEWWEKEGKYKSNIIVLCKPIRKPGLSQTLAEFAGIVLGDGGVTKNQVTITLHSKDDKEYGDFVVNLIKKLFNVYVGIYRRKKCKAINYNVSRIELVRFCTKNIGLKRGNKIKQQIDIPIWIKKNKLYSIACIRGLVDTDGCIFTHRYKINGKFYNYKKLSFTSYSQPLRKSVFNILKKNGLNPRFSRNRDIYLDSMTDVLKYFKIFNSHNPKHLKRFKN